MRDRYRLMVANWANVFMMTIFASRDMHFAGAAIHLGMVITSDK